MSELGGTDQAAVFRLLSGFGLELRVYPDEDTGGQCVQVPCADGCGVVFTFKPNGDFEEMVVCW